MIWMLAWLDLALWILWCTCLWLSEYVLMIGMVFLNVHKAFQSKLHTLMNSPFLAWFHDMCAYSLILSKSGVLTPFSPFSQTIYVPVGEGSLRWLWRRLGISPSSKWVGPHFPRTMPISILWSYFSLKTLMFFLFHLSTDCIAWMWIFYIDVRAMPKFL